MRITFLLPSDNLTGGTRVVAVYARELMALGHQVCVVTCAPDALPWCERLARLGQRLRGQPAPAAVPGHIALSGVPHRVLRRHGPITAADVPDADVVIATWWETAVWMHRLPPSKGAPVHLIQGYEVWFGGDTLPRVHDALRLPNTKIAISSDLKRTIEGALGPLGIHVVPNAVDPKQFDAPVRGRQPQPTVGFVYAQASIKGADLMGQACELARQRLPALQVRAFGTDEPSAAVPLPAGTAYTRRPPQHELRAHYAACDVWLFGSRLDSFGLPMLEAMACRTPVVAVPIGAAPELLAHGAGLLVPPENPQAMADAIVEVLQAPPAAWRDMSDRAHAQAHGYTWRDATQRLLALLPGAVPPAR